MTTDVRRAAWSALLLAALTDALLVPFYPQFFAQAFGSSSLVTPGLYVASCRLAIALTLPIWTRFTQRIPPLRLVALAQVIAGCAGLGCAMAPNLHTFLALSFVAEGARAAYLLLYPLLVQTAAPERRSAVVARVAAAINGTALIAAVAGGALLETMGGRTALVIAAISDFVQLLCLIRVVRKADMPGARAASPDASAAAAPTRAPATLYLLCLVTFFATCAIVLIRPHFTMFVDQEIAPGLPLWLLGLIFVVPGAVAVLATRLGQSAAQSPHARWWLIGSAWLLAVTALFQFTAPSLAMLVAWRMLYGLAIYLIDVTVDYATLCGDRDAYTQFGIVNAIQNAAIVVAPLAAGVLADAAGWSALFGTAFVVGAAAAVSAMALHMAASRALAARSANPV